MGNHPAISRSKHHRVLRVVKPDGKVLEFKAPMSVKDLLSNFENSRILMFKHSPQHLSEDFQLQIGNNYYIIPGRESDEIDTATVRSASASMAETEQCEDNTKRIKIVITKRQLQELLSGRVSMDDVVARATIEARDSESDSDRVGSGRRWKPELETIPE
ncbi:unnamed protein product [Rhodiola kirilowii]